jgi:diguanylate cyclase (GGDEF)-like protein
MYWSKSAETLGSQGHPTMADRRTLRRKDGSIFPIEVRRGALHSGDRDIVVAVAQDITNREQTEQELKEVHEKLGSGVKALEQRNREITLLAELSNFLISCVTVEEACNAIPRYCETLFPGESGALYLFRASRDHLNRYASWGGPQDQFPPIKPEDCWALRRGRPHTVLDPQKDAICGHISARHEGEPYICVPLVVQSDLLGLMWIVLADRECSGDETNARMNGKQQLAVALSEQIALALSNIRLRENLRQLTIRDALTGLYNRRFLEESLNREMARCKRNGTSFGVLMMDLDHFKRFNDTFGHDAGDSVLRSVAQALQENTREGDIACRFGGEEFIVVLPDTDRQGAATRAGRILAVARDLRVTHNGKTLGSITASIGLAMYPQNGETIKAIVQSADKALYEAKGAGRDRLVVAAD